MLWRPSLSIAGVRSGGSLPKYNPIDGSTRSGLPLGFILRDFAISCLGVLVRVVHRLLS